MDKALGHLEEITVWLIRGEVNVKLGI
jgi:hypothetical protein